MMETLLPVLRGHPGPSVLVCSLFFRVADHFLQRLPVPKVVQQDKFRSWRWRNLSVSMVHSLITGTWALTWWVSIWPVKHWDTIVYSQCTWCFSVGCVGSDSLWQAEQAAEGKGHVQTGSGDEGHNGILREEGKCLCTLWSAQIFFWYSTCILLTDVCRKQEIWTPKQKSQKIINWKNLISKQFLQKKRKWFHRVGTAWLILIHLERGQSELIRMNCPTIADFKF